MEGNCGQDVPSGIAAAEATAQRPVRVQPDVTVVVDGVEFEHFSQLLCLSSVFFDTALHAGMKEDQDKRVVLQGMNRKEWKMVSKCCFDPFAYNADATVTTADIDMLLPWFQFLQMTAWSKACERIKRQNFLNDEAIRSPPRFPTLWDYYTNTGDTLGGQRAFSQICKIFHNSSKDYNYKWFPDFFKGDLYPHFQRVLLFSPSFVTLDSAHMLVSAMKCSDPETKNFLWRDLLDRYAPKDLQDSASDNLDSVLANESLPAILLTGMKEKGPVARFP